MTITTTLSEAREAALEKLAEKPTLDILDVHIIEYISHEGLRRYTLMRQPVSVVKAIWAEHSHVSLGTTVAQHPVTEPEHVGVAAPDTHCDRCGDAVSDNAYSQTERGRLGPVTAYYCDACRNVLQAVGAGEYTAMDERRGYSDGYDGGIEHDYKQDY